MDQTHELFMKRCLELGERGVGKTLSNPMVGCVIVHHNRIISEGWHSKFGEDHAERMAIQKIAGDPRLRESTLYVNLEPCSHTGKTPPCANLIAESEIPLVVYGLKDPFDKVNGSGIEYLESKGTKTIGPILENECAWFNRRFVIFNTEKRPYIVLKWAQSADGFMAPESRERVQISGEKARILLHKWRAEEMATLVGANTVAADQPQLSVRLWEGKTNYRVFIDGSLKNQYAPGFGSTLVYNRLLDRNDGETEFVRVNSENMVAEIVQDLYQRKISSVMVEGGYRTIQYFLEAGIWDEIRVIRSKEIRMEHGLKAPMAEGVLFDKMELDTDNIYFYKK